MTLRGADAIQFLSFKETLTESDHVAVFSDGEKLPVFYRNRAGQRELWVDVGDQWFRTNTPGLGVARYERLPDPQPAVVKPPPSSEPAKLKGSSWAELRACAEEIERKARVEQRASRQTQQGIPTGDPELTRAGHDLAQVVASSKGQRRN